MAMMFAGMLAVGLLVILFVTAWTRR